MPPLSKENISQLHLKQFVKFLKDLGFVCLEKIQAMPEKKISKAEALDKLRQKVIICKKCPLWESRTNAVFGEGNPEAKLVFIGEAPGEKEDLQGRPFVGPAGSQLTRYIKEIGFSREEVFISNIVKCRPPENRDPAPDEIQTCEPYLIKQIEIIQPVLICALGKYAAQTLVGQKLPITKMRGNLYYYHNIKVLPTFHPASFLYSPSYRELFEQDFKKVRQIYEEQSKK